MSCMCKTGFNQATVLNTMVAAKLSAIIAAIAATHFSSALRRPSSALRRSSPAPRRAVEAVRRGGFDDDDEDEDEAYDDDADDEDDDEDYDDDDLEEDEFEDEEVLSGGLSGAGVAFVSRKLEAVAKIFGSGASFREANKRAELEQRVEDYNALQKASGSFHRAVLVLPLTSDFDPPPGQPGHGKVQFSDRVSMARSVGAELTKRAYEVPWHFELEALEPREDADLVRALGHAGEAVRSRELLSGRALANAPPARSRPGDAQGPGIGMLPRLDKVYCSPLDFRAPENFVFCPLWMLRELRVLPYDVLLVTWVKLNDGVTIELQPHQDAFLKLANPRAVLEAELKYYSSATRLSTISLLHDGAQYDFDVTATVGKDGLKVDEYNPEKCEAVAIQDADVSLDLAARGLDAIKKRKLVEADDDDDDDDDEEE